MTYTALFKPEDILQVVTGTVFLAACLGGVLGLWYRSMR